MAHTAPTDHYLPNAAYELLLQAILNPTPSLDPRSQLIETLGEIGGLWPMSCLADRDPVQMAEADMSRTRRNLVNDLSDEDEAVLATIQKMVTENYAQQIELAKVELHS
ncbi:hypothetical protein FHS72_002832 [Loktanella ponticola]|uniref:Uncharacterized protein n=1 Tax=Yoonia ponticola TaxID=1524255 RepID=A0A7W9BMJ3_9RHOB|nr:hypothetical protein [Yoonia ponticola]MBB5723195.1 hypothetical protein [Yoonia ponticola]